MFLLSTYQWMKKIVHCHIQEMAREHTWEFLWKLSASSLSLKSGLRTFFSEQRYSYSYILLEIWGDAIHQVVITQNWLDKSLNRHRIPPNLLGTLISTFRKGTKNWNILKLFWYQFLSTKLKLLNFISDFVLISSLYNWKGKWLRIPERTHSYT